ncbi:MAG: antitoxin [Actinobacteria bacterium]|nr:antitoxin [Actinomycetota bacterium]
MRTTVSIDDHLLAEARSQAQRRRMTLGQLIEESLRRELAQPSTDPAPDFPVFRGGRGARPGVDLDSNRGLAELLDEGRPVDQRR